METRASLTAVGLFVIAVIVAGFGAVSWLLGGARTANRDDIVIAFPGAITGLAPGASVTFNGIRIGQVSRFRYDTADPGIVEVVASVEKDAPIRSDSHIGLGYTGLTGVANIQIAGGSKNAPSVMASDARLHLRADSGSVQDVMEGAKQVMGKADTTLNEINALLRDNSPVVSRTLKNAETVSEAFAKNSGNIEKFMADLGRASDVLAKVADKADGLIANLDGIVQAVEPAKVRATLDNASRISADLAKASGSVEGIMTTVRQAADEVGKASAAAAVTVTDARKIVAAVDADKVRATVESVADLSKSLAGRGKEIDDIMARARKASADIETFTGKLAARSDDVGAIVSDTRDMVARLSEASKRVDGILAKVDGVVGSGEAQGMFAEVRTFLASATLAAQSIKATSDTFRSKADEIANGINGFTATSSRQIRDFVSDGRRMMTDIDRAVSEFDRNPQRLIFGGSGGKVPEYGPGRR